MDFAGYLIKWKIKLNRLSIKLNTQNHKVMQLKKIDNMRQTYESGLVDFLEFNLKMLLKEKISSRNEGSDFF